MFRHIILILALSPVGLLAGLATAQDMVITPEIIEVLRWIEAEGYVMSASNTAEKIDEAPATTIVLTRAELNARGYTELSQILDDLPGMEVTRPYGDTGLKNYWRGYRNTIGEPFLVMVDGLPFNHLYFNSGDTPLVTLPLSNIERVEVVYGPASSVYGANAFVGVINIFTRRDADENGSTLNGRMSGGSNNGRLADLNYFYKMEALRFSLTMRIDNGEVDRDAAQRYEFLKDKYYADRRIWGGFVDNPNIGGRFESPFQHRSLDGRVFWGNTEVGLQYYAHSAGYGMAYVADLVQSNAVWKRPELSLYARHSEKLLDDKVQTRTLVRYRRSDVSNDSYFVDGYFDAAQNSFVAAFSYWQALNASWTVAQEADVTVTDRISFNAGLSYEQKNLQKAYDVNGESASGTPGGYEPVGSIGADTYNYPDPPVNTFQHQNRIVTEQLGAYIQSRFQVLDNHRLHLGLRVDDQSEYGTTRTLRLGYTGRFDKLTLKLLYGEAYQEPVPRQLYGGWKGAGSDPDLKPEESKTVELSAGYQLADTKTLLSLWHVDNSKTIINTPDGAQNLGDRQVTGLDIHVQSTHKPGFCDRLELWAYYSHIFTAEETKTVTDGKKIKGDIGDLAKDKIWFGATAEFARLTTTLRGRYMGDRQTVDTNPVPSVAGYVTLDFNAIFKLFPSANWHISLQVNNLFDAIYDHPGIRDADAGVTPGYFDETGKYHGPGADRYYYSSLLPQPGRTVLISLHVGL